MVGRVDRCHTHLDRFNSNSQKGEMICGSVTRLCSKVVPRVCVRSLSSRIVSNDSQLPKVIKIRKEVRNDRTNFS